MYIGGRCSVSVLNPTPLGYWHGACHFFRSIDGAPFPPSLPASMLALAADPALRSTLTLAWDGAPPINPCYPAQIRRPDEVGLDPRVCVLPTVLPPKKNSHEKTYLISVVIFFCLCTDRSFCVL
jgi:hypothetical protein